MSGGGGGGDGKTPTLNVVSMVDVIFNVIVFFIITAKAASDENVKMAVPKVTNGNMHALPRDVPKLTVSAICNEKPDRVEEQVGMVRSGNIVGAMSGVSGSVRMVRVGKDEFKIRTGKAEEYTPVVNAIKKIAEARLRGAPPGTKVEVVLRGDLAASYDQIRPVMDAISAAGMEKVNLVGYKDK